MIRSRGVFLFLAASVALFHLVPLTNQVLGTQVIRPFILVEVLALGAAALGGTLVFRRFEAGTLSGLDFLVLGYLALSVGSYVFYLYPSHPAPPLQYIYGVHFIVLPMTLYFAVQTLSSTERVRLTCHLVAWNCVLIILGAILYVWRPEFHVTWLTEHYRDTEVADDALAFIRMNSYLGSISVGVIAAATIPLVRVTRLGPWWQYALAAILFVGALITGQRGGIVTAAAGVVFLLVTERSPVRRIVVAGVAALGATGVLTYLFAVSPEFFYWVRHRIASVPDALSGRTAAYGEGLRYLSDYPLGLGLGASSGAGDTGLNIRSEVSDANYLRIAADLGIAGLTLFLLILANAAARSIRSPERLAWGAAAGLICVVGLGSNVFDMYFVAHMLWLCIGMLGDPAPETVGAASAPRPPLRTLEPAR